MDLEIEGGFDHVREGFDISELSFRTFDPLIFHR